MYPEFEIMTLIQINMVDQNLKGVSAITKIMNLILIISVVKYFMWKEVSYGTIRGWT